MINTHHTHITRDITYLLYIILNSICFVRDKGYPVYPAHPAHFFDSGSKKEKKHAENDEVQGDE